MYCNRTPGFIRFHYAQQVTMYTFTDDLLSRIGGLQINDLNELVSNIDDSSERNNLLSQSPYYEINDIGATLKSDESHFTILSLNIQSIRSKFDEFSALIELAHEKKFCLSAICIQETGLTDHSDTNPFQIPGFK